MLADGYLHLLVSWEVSCCMGNFFRCGGFLKTMSRCRLLRGISCFLLDWMMKPFYLLDWMMIPSPHWTG